ncbi:peroxiredoxin [Alphaproteobacteria bacterium]|nr:peroxiredoxin [Alphaproteobacteria bacterium]
MKAPNFKLPSTSGTFHLRDHLGKNIILYFYPRDNTSGCSLEANDFNNSLKIINKLNAIVVGVSKDSIESHQKFIEKNNLRFDLLSDEKTTVLKKYKAWGKKNFLGKEYYGIIRSTVLIDKKGNIIKTWSNVRVKDHVKNVIEELSSI